MCAENHGTSIYTRHNCFHCSAVQKMFDRIAVAGFNRNCHTDVFSIRNLIFCIILEIPQFKLVGLEDICLRFIGKFIIISTGNTELNIVRQVDSWYGNSICTVIFFSKCCLLSISQIFLKICRTVILFDILVCTIKDIVLVSFRSHCCLWCLGCFRCFCYFWCLSYLRCFRWSDLRIFFGSIFCFVVFFGFLLFLCICFGCFWLTISFFWRLLSDFCFFLRAFFFSRSCCYFWCCFLVILCWIFLLPLICVGRILVFVIIILIFVIFCFGIVIISVIILRRIFIPLIRFLWIWFHSTYNHCHSAVNCVRFSIPSGNFWQHRRIVWFEYDIIRLHPFRRHAGWIYPGKCSILTVRKWNIRKRHWLFYGHVIRDQTA